MPIWGKIHGTFVLKKKKETRFIAVKHGSRVVLVCTAVLSGTFPKSCRPIKVNLPLWICHWVKQKSCSIHTIHSFFKTIISFIVRVFLEQGTAPPSPFAWKCSWLKSLSPTENAAYSRFGKTDEQDFRIEIPAIRRRSRLVNTRVLFWHW